MVQRSAGRNPLLAEYLVDYQQPGSVLDWGDDPGFFCADHQFGDPSRASWGVCRPDVRSRLMPGDYVVFFCAVQDLPQWHYFWVGVATMERGVSRQQLWSDPACTPYRSFFNTLAVARAGQLVNCEVFAEHTDWARRCSAPYWLFDKSLSAINTRTPQHVATYSGTRGTVETWRSREDARVRRLSSVLFPVGARRQLRTTNLQRAHPPINIAQQIPGVDLGAVRQELLTQCREGAPDD